MTRLALAGTGYWAAQLAAAVLRAPALELAAVYGRDPERRAGFAERFATRAAASWEDALDGVDGALLATPNDVHEEGAAVAAARGLGVLTEKPIAATAEAGERLRDTCERAGVVLAVGHEFRRLGSHRRAREIVESGALGTVVLAEANFSLASPVKPGTWKAGGRGAAMVQLGVHHADTLAYLLGPIQRTHGTIARVHSDLVDDVAVASVEFASGALGTIVSSYVSPRTYSIRLLGTEAVLDLRVDLAVWPEAHRLDAGTTLEAGGERIEFDRRDPLVEELEEFARCLAEGGRPETGAAEALAALKVVEEATA